MGERGGTTAAMTAVVGLLALMGVATASLGLALTARAAAQNAADAAALAAAVATYPGTGRPAPTIAAAVAAGANGAVLLSCACRMNASLEVRTVAVETMVRVDLPVFGVLPVRGAARAEFDPRLWLGR